MERIEKGQSPPGPLAPYRVLDLADKISGVYCTRILAALGADVIKIEPPGGDPMRRIGPFYHDEPHPEKSLNWFTYNLNKRSVTLNIQCATGQEVFKQLARTADFVVESFRPGSLDSLGLGYSGLSAINPRIILTSVTPFGQKGPYSQFKGSHLIASAAGGYVFQCGDEDRPPVQITTPVGELQAGLIAAAATMVAHWYRETTGEGQYVDVSAQEALNVLGLPRFMYWKSHGIMPRRTASGVMTGPPEGPEPDRFFECKDGLVFCDPTTAQYLPQLREWLASEGMAGDLFDEKWEPFFRGNLRVTREQAPYIAECFRAFTRKHTKMEVMFEGQKRGLEIVMVQDVRDLMADRHLQERGYWGKVEHPELNDAIVYGGAPFKSDVMSYGYSRRAPFIGEHNREILIGELGLSSQQLVILKEGGVI
ncbi:MAG: CoA transferase [Dehalococcoidales bacterium]|nr:CoA transferase [Dehalococcoidales bacterium]